MSTYLFRSRLGQHCPEGHLAQAVNEALSDIYRKGWIAHGRWNPIEVQDEAGPYVLIYVPCDVGWHFHNEKVFHAYGITCSLYPRA